VSPRSAASDATARGFPTRPHGLDRSRSAAPHFIFSHARTVAACAMGAPHTHLTAYDHID